MADHAIASIEIATKALDEELTPEESAALGTIDDPPLDLQWVSPASTKLREIGSEMTRMRDELVNNEAWLSELKEHLAKERRKLEEAPDEATRNRIAKRIKGLEDEMPTHLEIISGNREALRSQISRIRETLHRILHEDKTLAERIKTLFREQGITVVSILTALGMIISTIVLALPGGSGGGAALRPPPQSPGKGGVKEWLKKHLQSLGRILAKLAGKAAAALPGIIGSIVSWILSLLGKTAVRLAGNLWAVLLAVGGLLLVATFCPGYTSRHQLGYIRPRASRSRLGRAPGCGHGSSNQSVERCQILRRFSRTPRGRKDCLPLSIPAPGEFGPIYLPVYGVFGSTRGSGRRTAEGHQRQSNGHPPKLRNLWWHTKRRSLTGSVKTASGFYTKPGTCRLNKS